MAREKWQSLRDFARHLLVFLFESIERKHVKYACVQEFIVYREMGKRGVQGQVSISQYCVTISSMLMSCQILN